MKIVKMLQTTLAAPFGATDTEFTLSGFLTSKSAAAAMSDFGDWLVVVFKQGDVTEMVKCSDFEYNDDDSCTFTVASSGRDIDPTSPYAGSSEGQDFSAGADAIITNDPLTMSHYVNDEDDHTLGGKITFTQAPAASSDPIEDNDLTRKSWVAALVLGTLTTIDVIIPGTAGATVSAGQLVYFDTATGTWKLARADTANTVENTLLGIAQGAGTNGNAIANGVLLQGVDTHQSGMTIGAIEYASNTPGAISGTPGTKNVAVGVAKSATSLYFVPRFDQQLTNDQVAALAGDNGTPSSTNKFMTQSGFQAHAEIYGASAAGTDAYSIAPSPVISALAAGMIFYIKADVANTGAATLAINSVSAVAIKRPNGDDVQTGDILAGQIFSVVYDGTNFQLVNSKGNDYQVFTGSGTWTKPSGLTGNEMVVIQLWGAGGAGGGIAASTGGGGGGGGGAGVEVRVRASDLSSTVTVTIGAAGAAGTGNGGIGGTSTFGAYVSAYGGAGGVAGSGGSLMGGGGGGGALSAGAVGSTTTGGVGGEPGGGTAGGGGSGGGGGGGGSGGAGGNSYFGGGGGGSGTNTGAGNGGSSIYGGGGGGAGDAGATTGGSSKVGGAGGAGAGSNGDGTAGTAPGGGGGGARRSTSGTQSGGAGARGECRVWVIR
jgi:hypothetical protein